MREERDREAIGRLARSEDARRLVAMLQKRGGVQEAARAADWGPDTVFYADGSHGFADVYFQDLEGNWWHIQYRREPDARHGREVYVGQSRYSPNLRGYQVLDTGAE